LTGKAGNEDADVQAQARFSLKLNFRPES